jgi:hypothetical protein
MDLGERNRAALHLRIQLGGELQDSGKRSGSVSRLIPSEQLGQGGYVRIELTRGGTEADQAFPDGEKITLCVGVEAFEVFDDPVEGLSREMPFGRAPPQTLERDLKPVVRRHRVLIG